MLDKDFVIKAKKEYKKIGYVKCPAFGSEKVYFNQKGFRHLIMKNGKYRTHSDQVRRLSLIPQIASIVSSSKEIQGYRNLSGVKFWSLLKTIEGVRIIVVIRQMSRDKPKYFLSVMDKKLPKNAKAP